MQSSGHAELCHTNTGEVVTSHTKLGTMYPRIKLPREEHGQVYVCLDKSKLKKVMQMSNLCHCEDMLLFTDQYGPSLHMHEG